MALRRNQHNYAAAKRLRRTMTLPERLLWRELRGSPMGVSFRKQHPVGPYVLDFYCARSKTGFEIDGIAHDMGQRAEVDEDRDAWLAGQGIRVVRIAARDVLADPQEVARSMVAFCFSAAR